MPKCTTCQIEIEKHYCPECGKRYIGKRLNMPTLMADFFDNFFAMDNSFLSQMWIMLKDPKKVVQDYWDGYRRFYFSPNRVLLIGTIFIGLNFLITENEFLGVRFGSGYSFIGLSLVVFLVFLPFLTGSSMLTYTKFKKNFYEHLVLNIYTFSLWTMLFSLVSIVVYKIGWTRSESFIFPVFLLLVIVWNSRVFQLSLPKRILYCFLNCLYFSVILFTIVFLQGDLVLPEF